jgi:hypothetical protein
MKPLILAAALLLASPALATPPGVVISSDPTTRVEYLQFGGATLDTACTTDPCTIFSGSPAVLAVNRAQTGTYLIEFAPGTFSEPPTCTAIFGASGALVFVRQFRNPTTTEFPLEFIMPDQQSADGNGNVTCMGPYPAH